MQTRFTYPITDNKGIEFEFTCLAKAKLDMGEDPEIVKLELLEAKVSTVIDGIKLEIDIEDFATFPDRFSQPVVNALESVLEEHIWEEANEPDGCGYDLANQNI